MSRFHLLLLPVLSLAACARPAADPPVTPRPAPTGAQAGGLTYPGLAGVSQAVTLTDGRWEGEPYQPGATSRPTVVMADVILSVGDVGNDGTTDAVVVLGVRGGGPGNCIQPAGRSAVGGLS